VAGFGDIRPTSPRRFVSASRQQRANTLLGVLKEKSVSKLAGRPARPKAFHTAANGVGSQSNPRLVAGNG
ncbi:hypothetical protein, partial [Roseomonas mucosa]|uniref:hypothetical protein n=1 Tax=Roseomonas mucosa TaxID=207340 RepID=UPI001C0DD64E